MQRNGLSFADVGHDGSQGSSDLSSCNTHHGESKEAIPTPSSLEAGVPKRHRHEFAEDWPTSKKVFTVAVCTVLVFNTTMSSSLPSAASRPLAAAFGVTSEREMYLPVAVYLIGYIFGPIIFGPMSESLGRRISLLSAFFLYTVFTLACALAPNWPALLVFRFFVAIGASAPPTVLGGVFADLYPSLRSRGVAMLILAVATNVGPLTGPVVSGFSSQEDWRWMFWIALAMAGGLWPAMVFLSESYAPAIINPPFKRWNSGGVQDAHAHAEPGFTGAESTTDTETALVQLAGTVDSEPLVTKSSKRMLFTVLTRPIRMFFGEPLVFFTDIFLVLEYAMFFLYFEAYPIIFEGIYDMSPGVASLAFFPLFVGACLAMAICIQWDHIYLRARSARKEWALREEYRRLPMACIGGPLLGISQFWLGWTAKPSIHWAVPMLSGIPYGIGIELTFMALTNYLTDAYDIFAASALASSVFSRNIVACILLPLATTPMYLRLGVSWSCTIFGALCMAMAIIPFAFLRYGAAMRKRSPFSQQIEQHKRAETRR